MRKLFLLFAFVSCAAAAQAQSTPMIPDTLSPQIAAYTRVLAGRFADDQCRVLSPAERGPFRAAVAQNTRRIDRALAQSLDAGAVQSALVFIEGEARAYVTQDLAACPEEARVAVWRAQGEAQYLNEILPRARAAAAP